MSLGLDLTGIAESGTPVADGVYTCVVEKAEVKQTKTGGEMISVQLKVLDQGASFGRNIFTQFNIKNQNPQAVQIGLGQLKGFMRAAGKADPNRLESATELQGLKVVAKVKNEDDPQWGPQARVKSFMPAAKQASPLAPAPDQMAAPAPATANPFA